MDVRDRVRKILHAATAASPLKQLTAGTAAFLVLRLALSIPRRGPLVTADEVGYLMNARALAGGLSAQMSMAPFYHGGYSLVLAPLLALGRDPATTYHLVLVLNALLAASLAPLLYLLLTRCFGVSPRAAVWPALAAAAYPSVTIYTQVAMSENLLLPLTALWLLCFGCLLRATRDRHRAAWAVGTAVCAVWLWAAHGRMIVAVALTAIAFLLLVVTRHAAARPALLGLAVLGLGLLGVHTLNDFLVSRNYAGHAQNEVDQRLSTLKSASGVAAALRNLVGQAWYLIVATLGILVAALPRRLRSLGGLRPPSPAAAVLGLAGLTALGLLAESALSFRNAARPDMLIYGRYTDVIVPPLLAVALVRLGGARRYRTVLVVSVLAAATVATALLRTRIHPFHPANRWNVPSLPSPTFSLGVNVIVVAAVAAAIGVAVVAVAQHRAPAAIAPLVLLLFLPTTAVAERNPVLLAESVFYPSGWTSPPRAVDSGRTVAFDVDHFGSGLWIYQWFAPHTTFVLFSGRSSRPPSRLVISSSQWARTHPRLHAKPVWIDRSHDPDRNLELFRLGS
jgi:hypothetical protein